jgi:uncharacterized lipoprotein YmbA
MIRTLSALLVLGLAAMLAACSSTPTRFYTIDGVATASTAATPSPLAISVGPVSIPPLVDRPEIVVATAPNEVRLAEAHQWAAPLASQLSRALAQNLVVLLGAPTVTLFPQTSGADAQFRAAVEVQRFESREGEAALLEAVWTVRRMQDGTALTGRTAAREPVQGSGYEALAAAHSRNVARLGADVSEAIRKLAQ